MKTLEQAIRHAEALQVEDREGYAVVWSKGFMGQGPYFVVHVKQVPILVAEGAKLVWESNSVVV